MQTVNMLEAKSTLSRLVEAVELGETDVVIIARNGRPAAKLVAIEASKLDRHLGIAKGKFSVPENIDAHNEEVAKLFLGQ